jgi:hypothetical protein
MKEINTPRYFLPLFQRQLLGFLLQYPETYERYPGIWSHTYFDETHHRLIAHAYLKIRQSGGEHPTEASLLQELFKDIDPRAPVPMDMQALRKEVEALYKIPVANLDYSLNEVSSFAKNAAMVTAIGESVDLLQAGKIEEIIPLISDALSTGVGTTLAGHDFYVTPPALEPEIFPGLLRKRGIGLLLASSKSYKSWNLQAAAIAAAKGKSWMGFPDCVPVRTLYTNLELEPEELKKRLDIVCPAYNLSRAELEGHLSFLNLKGYANGIDAVLRQIRSAAIAARKPWRLIIIDPIYKLYSGLEGGENGNIENSNTAIGALFEKLERLARELDAAIFLCHHLKKGRNADTLTIDLGSGAGAFARGPDALLAFRALEEEGAWKCGCTVRYFPKIEPFGVRIDFPLIKRDSALDLEAVAQKGGTSKKYTVADALSQLTSNGLTSREWQEAVEEHLGCDRKTFYRLRDEAKARNLVRLEGPENKHSTRYFLTDLAAGMLEKADKFNRIKAVLKQTRIAGNGH